MLAGLDDLRAPALLGKLEQLRATKDASAARELEKEGALRAQAADEAERRGVERLSLLRRQLAARRERALAPRGELTCLLYTSPSPRDGLLSRMPSSA